MAKVATPKKDYTTLNKERVEKMLEKDPGAVKAVIANTIETRKVAAKLQALDIIFNNARQNIGYQVTFSQFETMFEKFKIAEMAIDEIITFAEEAGIYKSYKKKDTNSFASNKNKLEALVAAGKTNAEIAAHFGIDEKKAEGWISIVQPKDKTEHQEEVKSKAKAASLKEKEEVKEAVA